MAVGAERAPANSGNEQYPLSKRLTVSFNPVEDRLTVLVERMSHPTVSMWLTRRMVILVLRQLLEKLPEVSGLDKTPREFWQDVLQLEYEHAVQKQDSDAPGPITRTFLSQQMSHTLPGQAHEDAQQQSTKPLPVYLASDLLRQYNSEQRLLTLAFKGSALQTDGRRSDPEPIVAMQMQVDALHQLIRLMVDQAKRADWHLPMELPWMAPANPDATPPKTTH